MIEGSTIVNVREMTDEEAEKQGWNHSRKTIPVIELSSGVVLYPSKDGAGNDPGVLFGHDTEENYFSVEP